MDKSLWLMLLPALLVPFLLQAQNRSRRPLGDFSRIQLTGHADLYLTPADSNLLVLEAGESVNLDDYDARILGNTLYLDFEKGRREWGLEPRVTLYLSYRRLDALRIEGKVRVKTEAPLQSERFTLETEGFFRGKFQLQVGRLKCHHEGFAQVELEGEAEQAEMDFDGYGRIDAEELRTRRAEATATGMVKFKLYAEESLEADLEGVTKLKYRGHPSEKTIRKEGLTIVEKS